MRMRLHIEEHWLSVGVAAHGNGWRWAKHLFNIPSPFAWKLNQATKKRERGGSLVDTVRAFMSANVQKDLK